MTRSKFDRNALPAPATYFERIGNPLRGRGPWRSALCPFHDDTRPSLRVHAESGAYRCMVCGARGGGVLDLHMARTGRRFVEAARELGAWQ